MSSQKDLKKFIHFCVSSAFSSKYWYGYVNSHRGNCLALVWNNKDFQSRTKLNSSLSLRVAVLKFCLPWAGLSLNFQLSLQMTCLSPYTMGKWEWKFTCPVGQSACHRQPDSTFSKPCIVNKVFSFFVDYLRGLEWLCWLKAGWSIWPFVRTVWWHKWGRYHFLSPALEILLWSSRISDCDKRWWEHRLPLGLL